MTDRLQKYVEFAEGSGLTDVKLLAEVRATLALERIAAALEHPGVRDQLSNIEMNLRAGR
jgi:hypothetical protein